MLSSQARPQFLCILADLSTWGGYAEALHCNPCTHDSLKSLPDDKQLTGGSTVVHFMLVTSREYLFSTWAIITVYVAVSAVWSWYCRTGVAQYCLFFMIPLSLVTCLQLAGVAGGLFEFVSCPHYLAEIIVYTGLCISSEGQLMTLLMLVWVVSAHSPSTGT